MHRVFKIVPNSDTIHMQGRSRYSLSWEILSLAGSASRTGGQLSWPKDAVAHISPICVKTLSAFLPPQITIIFKAHRECTDQKVYQAVTDDLPAAFVDGSTCGGDGDPKSLRIVERESGRSVEMHARYMGTTVFVRQLGRYLTLAIRMPEALAMAYEESQDLQLCVTGCPLGERIDDGQGQVSAILGPGLPRSPAAPAWPGYTLETASARCHEQMPVKDIYFQSCVFDLLTTGDANFTAAAHSALEDVEALHPRKERWHIFPSSARGAPRGRPLSSVSLGLTCLILVVFL